MASVSSHHLWTSDGHWEWVGDRSWRAGGTKCESSKNVALKHTYTIERKQKAFFKKRKERYKNKPHKELLHHHLLIFGIFHFSLYKIRIFFSPYAMQKSWASPSMWIKVLSSSIWNRTVLPNQFHSVNVWTHSDAIEQGYRTLVSCMITEFLKWKKSFSSALGEPSASALCFPFECDSSGEACLYNLQHQSSVWTQPPPLKFTDISSKKKKISMNWQQILFFSSSSIACTE